MTTDHQLDTSITRSEAELGRLLEWVRAAESRLAFVLPLATAMLGVLAVFAPAASKWDLCGGIAVSLAAIPLLLSIVCTAVASFPRTRGSKKSLIFFGGIAERDLEQYMSAVRSMTSEEYLFDLITQCHKNAQISKQKYAWFQRSILCLFIAAGPWVYSLFILYSKKS